MHETRGPIRDMAMAQELDEKYFEAIEELRLLAEEIHSRAEDSTYGYFHGGDPRNFCPDPDASTEEERENHRLACEAYTVGKPDSNPFPAPHCAFMNGGVAPKGFGLGVNNHVDEELLSWADMIYRAVDRICKS